MDKNAVNLPMVKFSAPHEIVNKNGNFISKRGNEMNLYGWKKKIITRVRIFRLNFYSLFWVVSRHVYRGGF